VRNKNKLALSSRNSLLNIDELTKAEKFSKSLVLLKRKLLKNNNINTVLANKKKELSNLFAIQIDYLELRNIYNLKKSNKTKNSKLFVAYHINKVRLIDNF
jgi:pantoate--beta-alanine ligase